MLALTRKPGERLVIGDSIVVTIIEVKGDNVRVAIDAPKDIKIYRGELYDAIVGENVRAAAPVNLADMDKLKNIQKKNRTI